MLTDYAVAIPGKMTLACLEHILRADYNFLK